MTRKITKNNTIFLPQLENKDIAIFTITDSGVRIEYK